MGNELTIIEKINPVEVFTKENGAVTLVDEIAKFYRSIDRDVSTTKGRANIASIAGKIRGNKAELGRMKDAVKEGLKKQVDIIDAEARRIKTALENLEEEIRKPLTEFEEKEETRVNVHEERLQTIANRALFVSEVPTSETVQKRIDSLKDFDAVEWEEFKERGKQALEATKSSLEKQLSDRKKYEAEQAELARLRAEEIERKRQEELKASAEKAKLEAEQKAAQEAERVAAIAKAEADRIEANRVAEEKLRIAAEKSAADAKTAKEAAEKKSASDLKAAQEKAAEDARVAAEKAEREKQAAVAAEQKRAADAKAAEAAAAAKREADIAHTKKINNEALAALIKAGISDDAAKIVIVAIAKNAIPHISIKY